MANDSGLNPVTPNSSVHSCTAVPITPCSRPSPPVSHTTGQRAPGTLAWRWVLCPLIPCLLWPEPPVPVLGQTWLYVTAWGLLHTVFRGAGTSGKAILGFGDPSTPWCLVLVWPSSPVLRTHRLQALCINLLHHPPCCLQLCCPCSLLSLS